MNTRTVIAGVLLGAVVLSAQDNDTAAADAPAPVARHTIALFTAAQHDSVLSLIPGIDSLRRSSDIIGVGRDTVDNAIVVIAFDRSGMPVKNVFPDSVLMPRPAAAAPALPGPVRAQTPPRPDQRGRTWFIIETALKSTYVYPVSYSNAFPRADEGFIGGLSLLTIGGSLYGTFAFTKNMELGYGRVGLMNFGSTFLGIHYPDLLGSFLRNATSIDDGYVSDTSDRPVPSSLVSAWMSMAGFPAGVYLGSRLNIVDRNDAGKITLMGFFSQPTAYLLGYGLPFYFLYPAKERREYFGASALLTMALMPAGFYAGHKIAGTGPVPTGRGSLPYVTGIMGGLTGLYIPTLFYRDIHTIPISMARLLVTTTIAGYGGGTVLGLLYHPSIDYTYWQTVFIGASSGAGALMFIALPMMGEVKITDTYKPFVIAGVLGGWTGFLLGDRLSQSLFEKSDRDRSGSGLRVTLPGLAALPFILSHDRDGSRRSCPSLPVAELEWRF